MRTGRRSAISWSVACAALLAGASAPAQDVYHDNVVVILDSSGSMSETMKGTQVVKIDAAKAALKEVLRTVPESTRIGLLVFSSRNLRSDWAYPLAPRDDAQLVRAIDLPEPGGSTPLGAYIKKGADRLLEERARQLGYGTYRLLIVTDGEAQDQALVDRYTPEVIARGITVDVIGVDMRQAHTLATRVNSYRRANDPASLTKALAEVFAEVSSGGSDAADAEAFALLAPIPTEVASAAINALSTSGNYPVGERPASAAREVGGEPEAREASQAPGVVPASGAGGSGSVTTFLVVAVVVASMILGAVLRQKNRGA